MGRSGAQKMFARREAIKLFLQHHKFDREEMKFFTTGFNMGWKMRGERDTGSVFGGNGIWRKVKKQEESEKVKK